MIKVEFFHAGKDNVSKNVAVLIVLDRLRHIS